MFPEKQQVGLIAVFRLFESKCYSSEVIDVSCSFECTREDPPGELPAIEKTDKIRVSEALASWREIPRWRGSGAKKCCSVHVTQQTKATAACASLAALSLVSGLVRGPGLRSVIRPRLRFHRNDNEQSRYHCGETGIGSI